MEFEDSREPLLFDQEDWIQEEVAIGLDDWRAYFRYQKED